MHAAVSNIRTGRWPRLLRVDRLRFSGRSAAAKLPRFTAGAVSSDDGPIQRRGHVPRASTASHRGGAKVASDGGVVRRQQRRSPRVVLKTITAGSFNPVAGMGRLLALGLRPGAEAKSRFHDLRCAAQRRPMCGSEAGAPRRTAALGRGRGLRAVDSKRRR
jgi:hypothetical protein